MSLAPVWTIRRLRHDDLPLYRPLRLEALRAHPEAFGSSWQEEQGSDLAHMINESPDVTLGAFVANELLGTAGLVVPQRRKQRHKGHVVGVYVALAWRRTGLAQALLQSLIAEARANSLVLLTLSVTVGNEAARRLYLQAGFVTYGIEPASLMIGSDLLDEDLMALRL